MAVLILVVLAALLVAVGVAWLREREKERRQELRREVLHKLRRSSAHANAVIDELQLRAEHARLSSAEREQSVSGAAVPLSPIRTAAHFNGRPVAVLMSLR